MESNMEILLNQGEGNSFWVLSDLYTFKVTGKQTNGAFTVIDQIVQPQSGPPPHIHHLEEKGVCLYIHNLGCTIGKDCDKDSIFTKLIVTIMADLARMESEQLSQRIKSGIRNRKDKGLHTGRKVNSIESKERFLGKHKDVQKYLNLGRSYSEITKLTGAAPYTISKVKKALTGEWA